MLVLFHCLTARSFRPLWALQELNLECDLRVMPFPPRVHARAYMKENPLGTVPLFIDGEARMTESAAICQYLAGRYGADILDVPKVSDHYAAYLNYLHFGEATLTFPQTLILRYRYFECPERRQPQVAEDYTKWFLARLRTLESRLSEHEYLCGQRFSAADISVGYALLLAKHLGLDTGFSPAVSAYWQRLEARSGYRRAMEIQFAAARTQAVDLTPSPDLRPFT